MPPWLLVLAPVSMLYFALLLLLLLLLLLELCIAALVFSPTPPSPGLPLPPLSLNKAFCDRRGFDWLLAFAQGNCNSLQQGCLHPRTLFFVGRDALPRPAFVPTGFPSA